MSTYINTNTTATQAAMALDNNNNSLSNSIEQLSTGLSINNASDNPAGYVVSEDMSAQLSGLNQATSNSNEAINETQTAESALNQVQNLLISMRSLAVQASNTGANDSTDLQADQTQIASAIQSINQIASNTQYGDVNLLDGSASAGLTTSSGSSSAAGSLTVLAQGAWGAADAGTYNSATVSQVSPATVSVGTTDITGGTPAALSGTNTTFSGSVAINGTTYTIGNGTTAVNLSSLNTSIASSGYQASFNSSGNLVFTAQTDGPVTTPTINASGLLISGSTSSIASTATDLAKVSTFATAAGTGGDLAATTSTSVSGTLQLAQTGGSTFSQTFSPGTTLAQVQTALNSTFGTGADAVTATIAAGALVFTSAGGDLVSTGSDLSAFNDVTPPSTSTFTNGTSPTLTLSDGGTSLVSTNTQQNGSNYDYTFANGLIVSTGIAPSATGTTTLNASLTSTAGSTSAGQDLQFQLGANGGQTASLSIGSVAADQLGQGAASYTDADGNKQTVDTDSVADINVTTFKGAQDAIQVLDQAIDQVSTLGANLGAFQTNILQSNVASLGVATTNLQASQATVEDTDMATTITQYTQQSVLVQSATSALSFAQQMPQNILKLLQSA